MGTYESAPKGSKVTWPTHVTVVLQACVECQGVVLVENLGFVTRSTLQPSWHTRAGQAMCTLWYQRPPHPWVPFTQTHTWAYADNSHLWCPSDSPRWHLAGEVESVCACVSVCVCVCMCVFVSAGLCAEGKTAGWGGSGVGGGGWGDKSCGADVPSASGASWMAAVVMVTGKRVGGLAYALQSSEWLEFSMVEKTSSCVQSGNKAASSSLFFPLSLSIAFPLSSLALNYCPSVNVAVIFIALRGLIVTQIVLGTSKIVVKPKDDISLSCFFFIL